VTSTNSSLGALVLAHSLRDAGASRKLAVLVTLDTVSADSITQLKVNLPPECLPVLEPPNADTIVPEGLRLHLPCAAHS